ncbi:PPOX class F420-dependent oxidoreductase [Microbacterium sediminicola]|uniref:PPOX class F420-dependent oxidoreductase n=1 Tax=Microbacterium sediminicola TaxID=415210 RepID=A0ABP4TXN0_9MICO
MNELIPPAFLPLLERPLYGHLATIRPDDTVQVTPMWYEFDGEFVRFTHTTKRQKYRNLRHNPAMALSIVDPDNPSHYLEVAGALVEVVPDPEGAFFQRLQVRYTGASAAPPPDAADRVVLVMSIARVTKQ